MVQICERTKSKDDMLFENIEQYKEVFLMARREFEKVVQVQEFPYSIIVWNLNLGGF
jgi:DNA topoisomerase-3